MSHVAGLAPENIEELEMGATHHQQHGNLLLQAHLARGLAYVLVFLAVSVFVFVLIRGV